MSQIIFQCLFTSEFGGKQNMGIDISDVMMVKEIKKQILEHSLIIPAASIFDFVSPYQSSLS